jgi:hypothetical protein
MFFLKKFLGPEKGITGGQNFTGQGRRAGGCPHRHQVEILRRHDQGLTRPNHAKVSTKIHSENSAQSNTIPPNEKPSKVLYLVITLSS